MTFLLMRHYNIIIQSLREAALFAPSLVGPIVNKKRSRSGVDLDVNGVSYWTCSQNVFHLNTHVSHNKRSVTANKPQNVGTCS